MYPDEIDPQGPFTVEREDEPGQWVEMATASSYGRAVAIAHDAHRRVRNAAGKVVFPCDDQTE